MSASLFPSSEARESHEGGVSDLERTVEIIAEAAAAIDGMLQYNMTMKSVANDGVAHYRMQAQEARERADSLEARLAIVETETKTLVDAYEFQLQTCREQISRHLREIEMLRSLLWPDKDKAER